MQKGNTTPNRFKKRQTKLFPFEKSLNLDKDACASLDCSQHPVGTVFLLCRILNNQNGSADIYGYRYHSDKTKNVPVFRYSSLHFTVYGRAGRLRTEPTGRYAELHPLFMSLYPFFNFKAIVFFSPFIFDHYDGFHEKSGFCSRRCRSWSNCTKLTLSA